MAKPLRDIIKRMARSPMDAKYILWHMKGRNSIKTNNDQPTEVMAKLTQPKHDPGERMGNTEEGDSDYDEWPAEVSEGKRQEEKDENEREKNLERLNKRNEKNVEKIKEKFKHRLDELSDRVLNAYIRKAGAKYDHPLKSFPRSLRRKAAKHQKGIDTATLMQDPMREFDESVTVVDELAAKRDLGNIRSKLADAEYDAYINSDAFYDKILHQMDRAQSLASAANKKVGSFLRKYHLKQSRKSAKRADAINENVINEERKESAHVVSAFLNKKPAKGKRSHTDGAALYLHGNKIAWHGQNGAIHATMAGWGTTTTRDRLNTLARRVGLSQFSQKKGVQHYGNKPISSDEIVTLRPPLAESKINEGILKAPSWLSKK